MRSAKWILLALFVIGIAGCRAPEPPTPVLTPAENITPTAPPVLGDATWATYHGSPALEGVADVVLAEALAPVWHYDATGQVYNTPVSGKDRIAFSDSKGVIHVLDMDGKPMWTKAITEESSGGRPLVAAIFDAPLAIFDGVLIACSATGVVHAWNVADGTERWVTRTDAAVLGSPNFAVVNSAGKNRRCLFFVDQAIGALQCLDLETGEKLWSGEGVERCDGSPAASAKHVVYGSCASAIHVFSTADGAKLRDIVIDDDSQVAGGVVLLGDLVFSGSRSGKFIHANVETGATIWINTDCEGEAFSTPAVSKDHIIFSANDACVYALDRKSGTLMWKRDLDDTPSSAVIARDKVIISADGKLHLLRLSDGEVLWSYPVSDEITAPGMAGSLVLVGGDDGTVTALGGKTGA